MNQPKPVGKMHFAGQIEVPVYSPDDKPETVYNVQEGLQKLRSMLDDRKLCRKMDERQYQAVLNQFAYYSVLAAFNVPTYPVIHNGEQPASDEAIEALEKLKSTRS